MSIHFWEGFCFISLIALIFKPVRNFVLNGLDAYSRHISLKIKEAEDLRLSAEKTIKFYQEQDAKFAILAKEIQEVSNQNIAKLTEDHKELLEHKMRAKKLLHMDRLVVYDKEEMNKIKVTLMSKAIVIAQMYLRDHGKMSVTPPQIQEALHVIKNKKVEIH